MSRTWRRVVVLILAQLAVVPSPAVMAQAPFVVDANAAFVGYFTSIGFQSDYQLVSATGYRFAARALTGAVFAPAEVRLMSTDIYFTSADCSGQAYAQIQNNSVVGGFVFRATFGDYWYAPKSANSQSERPFASMRALGGSCVATAGTSFSMPVLPNDPSVTNVAPGNYAPPLTLGVVGQPLLFRDGFETT